MTISLCWFFVRVSRFFLCSVALGLPSEVQDGIVALIVPCFSCTQFFAEFVISTRFVARIQAFLRSTACELLSRPQIFHGSARSAHGTVTGLESRGSPLHQWFVDCGCESLKNI